MRGVVSLASALAIPITLSDGTDFPHRNLILFITFVVILVTLVFQGLTLPLFIKLLKLKEIDDYRPEVEQLEEIRLRLAKSSMNYVDKHYSEELQEFESMAKLKEQIMRNITMSELNLSEQNDEATARSERKLNRKVLLELIKLRRSNLHAIKNEKKYDDSVIRDMEHTLDLEEARLSKY